MSVGILIITHSKVGAALAESVVDIFGADLPLPIKVLKPSLDCDPDKTTRQVRKQITHMDQGEGVLILTDMYGSTPCNIVTRLLETLPNIRIVTGLNLPMLIRIMNYPRSNLDTLAAKAVSGGHEGVLCCEKEGIKTPLPYFTDAPLEMAV